MAREYLTKGDADEIGHDEVLTYELKSVSRDFHKGKLAVRQPPYQSRSGAQIPLVNTFGTCPSSKNVSRDAVERI